MAQLSQVVAIRVVLDGPEITRREAQAMELALPRVVVPVPDLTVVDRGPDGLTRRQLRMVRRG